MCLSELWDQGLALLPARASESRREAALLLAHVLRRPTPWLYAHTRDPVPPLARQRFERLVERRARGEPAAYLMGRREFWSLDLEVTPAVLVPRPETERLVEIALDLIPVSARLRLADLGTGCGAIALALARERPGCHVIATDTSPAALALAASNAARLRIGNVEFRRGHWCVALGRDRPALVVANPPYVPSGDPHLEGDGVRFEPREALVAGADGLDAIREIVSCTPLCLPPEGKLLLEHGAGQEGAVRRLLAEHLFRGIAQFRDYAGRERVVCASRALGRGQADSNAPRVAIPHASTETR